jgi:hypothetical protein
VAVDALDQVVGGHVLVALGGFGVAVPKLLLDEAQRLTLDEPVGRGGVAQVWRSFLPLVRAMSRR